jgi:hypothetical protein
MVDSPIQKIIAVPEAPLSGSSYVGPGVAGAGFGKGIPGVSGTSAAPPPPVEGVATSLTPVTDQIGDGVYGDGLNGVHGVSAYNAGVLGENTGRGPGVLGTSTSGVGVSGESLNDDGVYGQSTGAFGVHGRNLTGPALPSIGGPPPTPPTATSTPPASLAATLQVKECGVFGESYIEAGVFGASAFQYGVHGVGGALSGMSPADASVVGVRADSSIGYGVYATSAQHAGVYGETSTSTQVGVHGVNNAAWPCAAMLGSSSHGHGIQGVNQSGSGKTPTFGCGVWGDSNQGYGVYGASKTGTAGYFDGDVTVTGHVTAADVILSGADCAEEFDAACELEPGWVAVMDQNGSLTPCVSAYDKRVVGVVSGAGAYQPAIVMDRRETSRERAPVALVGKVYCWVDATETPVQVGDLLTSSPTSGHAMRAADPVRAFGAIIGKALQPLPSGQALLPILVALR